MDKYVNFTTNQQKLISYMLQIIGVIFYYFNKKIIFIIFFVASYFVNYMNKTYKQLPIDKTMFDFITNIIVGALLLIVYFKNHNVITSSIPLVLMLIVTWLHILNYSITKATINYKKHKSDDFYEQERTKIESKSILGKLYLLVNKLIYRHYKFIMGDFNEKTSESLIKLLKPFGPTFYQFIMIIIISYQ